MPEEKHKESKEDKQHNRQTELEIVNENEKREKLKRNLKLMHVNQNAPPYQKHPYNMCVL